MEFLNGDLGLPILSRHNKLRTSSLYTVRAILDSPAKYLCAKHPSRININCEFVVDTAKLKDAEDIKCDDCGVWIQTKTATTYLKIVLSDDGSVDSVECVLFKGRKKYFTLIRRHYICK